MHYNVISTDDHLTEGPETFDRLPEKFRDRQPRILRGPDGGDGWSFDGKPPTNTFGLNAVAGRPYEDYKESGLKLEEILPGNYIGAEHLKDMDTDGVDAAVIFPLASLAAYSVPDREFGLALMRTYNDWLLEDYCSADPKRMIGLPLVPTDDGQEAMVAEAKRLIDKGVRGVFLPYFTAVPYYDEYFDPLWSVLSEARVAGAIHRTMGGNAPKDAAGTISTKDKPGVNIAGIVERFFSGVAPLSRLIYTGTFERHPNLVIVDAEVNGGWVPFWLQMMEQEYERQRHWAKPPITKPPSEFVGRNVFFTALDDFVGFELAKTDDVLARSMTWSSDYPHSTTLWPKSQEYIKTLTAGMDDERRHALVAGNAIRAFALSEA